MKAYANTLKEKKILVVGMGRSGQAAVKELVRIGAKVDANDSKPEAEIEKGLITSLEEMGAGVYFGHLPEDMSVYDMVVVSPGVPADLPFLKEAREGGAEVIGELELSYRLAEGRFVAITGTNGKTTTTTLVGEIFRAAGRKTAVVGNIGVAAVTQAAASSADEWLVTEASSFQLETTSRFRPVVSAVLNLTPDHLNRHKTMEAYAAAKAAVFANQTEDDFLVINGEDEACLAMAERAAARVIPFSINRKLGQGAFLDGDELVLVTIDGDRKKICSRDDLRIIGDHNIENALAAAALSYYAGVDMAVIGKTIADFPGVEHRIEYCGTIEGVKFYNDSKGTNVDASLIALKALKENIILIAGGDGKGQDFTELGEHLDGAVKALVLLGRDGPAVGAAAEAAGFTEIYSCADMEECVAKAMDLAQDGDSVLLSPACASWDMYSDYEARGRHFKSCVAEIKNKADIL